MLFRTACKLIVLPQWHGNKELKKGKKERKKERNCSRRYIFSRFSPMNCEKRLLSEKVSFCTSYKKIKKASLCIETAFVLPIFFLASLTIVSFMDLYKLETEHLVELCEKTKTAGMYAYVLNEDGPQDISLPDLYAYEPIGGFIRLPKIWHCNIVKVHAWTGKTYTEEEREKYKNENERMVYVTETGSVYHVDPGCTYLDLSIHTEAGNNIQNSTNSYGQHYNACEICSKNQTAADTVYVTDSGTSYHNLETCSGLKRTVCLVNESQVTGKHVCSRCG